MYPPAPVEWEGPLCIGPPALSRAGTRWRLEADIAGEPLWFETSEAALACSPEAFASAAFLPAMASGRALSSAAPLSAAWQGGARRVAAAARTIWGWPEVEVAAAVSVALPEPIPATALAFSLGADSFHTLLTRPGHIAYLVRVEGYEIPADDPRCPAIRDHVREVAAAVSASPVFVRTNFRTHRLSSLIAWNDSHGGLLAAVGHALAVTAGRFVISSSYPARDLPPWGSRIDLDPHWSSERLTVEHFGAEQYRSEKLREIAADALMRAHLRVCNVDRSKTLNCGSCEKCIRTQIVLLTAGAPDDGEIFPMGRSLAARIDALDRYRNPGFDRVYEAFLEFELPVDVRRAIERLCERSARGARRPLPPLRLYRKMRGRPERRHAPY